jgi:hypothetical protein
MSEPPIRARTQEERAAWLAGYAAAVYDAANHGVEMAQVTLRTIYEADSHPQDSTERTDDA